MTNPTVACVLRASPVFRPSAVVRLFEDVREHWLGPLDFLCITDTAIGHDGIREVELRHPWPGYWSKLNLFHPSIEGPLLYFDLDVMVCGSLADFQATRRLTMLRALRPRAGCHVNSSIMYLPKAARRPVWRRFIRDPERVIKSHAWRTGASVYAFGDQGFLEGTWTKRRKSIAFWQETHPGQVESYKAGVRKRGGVGPNTRVVYFHGNPRPWDMGWELPPRREVQ